MTVKTINKNAAEFRKALTKLATDLKYRNEATKAPSNITKDFNLTPEELKALREVAILSGADVAEIDKLRLHESGPHAEAVNVHVHCCCCCCCGETGLAPSLWTAV
jgi:hypothetical protein